MVSSFRVMRISRLRWERFWIFIEEAEIGDLAFFENEEGRIIHVGIMLENQKIIHAHGKVRIDDLDCIGIFNKDQNKHTHKLRFVKRICPNP